MERQGLEKLTRAELLELATAALKKCDELENELRQVHARREAAPQDANDERIARRVVSALLAQLELEMRDQPRGSAAG